MSRKSFLRVAVSLVIVAAFAAACGTPTAEVPTPEEEPAAQEPTELNIAAIFIDPLEEPWNLSWVQSMEAVMADPPHGLTINLDYSENVSGADTQRVLRDYAESGEYQIIWAHSNYSDDTAMVRGDFPDILWVVTADPNEGGGNQYYLNMLVHEPAYLLGMLAGLTTETNVVGAVGSFPYVDVNTPLNGYIDGVRAVNPDAEVRLTFIESWYDPALAAEATRAQIATRADRIYAERYGVFEAAGEAGVLAFGHFMDQNELAPDVVISSTVANWGPHIRFIIDEWWTHATTGEPYDAPTDMIWFTMAEGGNDLAPLHGFEDTLPEDVIAQVMQARQQILDGTLVIEPNPEPPSIQ